MSTRAVVLMLAAIGLAATPAVADRLILEDGRVLRGEYARQGDVYTLVTEDGETLTFTKEQVKRAIYESRVTPGDAAVMLAEFIELVKPALSAPEPDEYIWSRQVTTTASESDRTASSASVGASDRVVIRGSRGTHESSVAAARREHESHSSSSGRIESETLRMKGIDDVFVSEWVRYTDQFTRLLRNARYKELTNFRKRSGSLAEFANYPPEDHQAEANAVQQALRAMRQCINNAETSCRQVQLIPKRRDKFEADIRELKDKKASAEGKSSTGKDRKRQKKRARRAADDVNEQISENLGVAAELLGAAYGEEYWTDPASAAGDTLRLTDAVERGWQLIEAHRRRAVNLTSLGLGQLRTDTETSLRQLLTGKTFDMILWVTDIELTPDNSYLLLAVDRSESLGDPAVLAALAFGPRLYENLGAGACKKGDNILVVGNVHDVTLIPGLAALEQAADQPTFSLAGSLVAVEKGCPR